MICLLVQFLFILLLLIFKRKYSNFRIAVIASIFLYFSMILFAQAEGYILEAKAEACDTNRDGFWSPEEHANCEETLNKLTSDTGRNLVFIFGIPFVFVWFTIVYSLLWLFRIHIEKLFNRYPIITVK